jgi:hypothetical protein
MGTWAQRFILDPAWPLWLVAWPAVSYQSSISGCVTGSIQTLERGGVHSSIWWGIFTVSAMHVVGYLSM